MEAEQTEIPEKWIERFKSDVRDNPVARNAWKQLEAAGLREGALLLLYGYAGGSAIDVKRVHKSCREADRRIKAALRATEIAKTKPEDLFQRRATEKRAFALNSDFPPPSDDIQTVGDMILAGATEREPSLSVVRKSLIKSAGKRSPITSCMYFLFLLQGYSRKNGVQLGYKRLLALANSADDQRQLDESTLARFFKRIPKQSEILRVTLPKLPTP
jgi:hypothetical protein